MQDRNYPKQKINVDISLFDQIDDTDEIGSSFNRKSIKNETFG